MKLEEQIDHLQDLVTRGYGRGSAVSLDPPGTRRGQKLWEGTIWEPSGATASLDGAKTKEALVITMLATAREEVVRVEGEDEVEYEEADEGGD